MENRRIRPGTYGAIDGGNDVKRDKWMRLLAFAIIYFVWGLASVGAITTTGSKAHAPARLAAEETD
jgi:hypothetical protein